VQIGTASQLIRKEKTMVWLYTLGSLVAYGAGLTLLIKITPRLARLTFDDAFFVGVAALTIFGAMLAFGAIGVTFGLFYGAIGVKFLDFILLAILVLIALRTAMAVSRTRFITEYQGQQVAQPSPRISRIMAWTFCLMVAAGAAYVLVRLFT
jgi:hypothetical protein